MVQVYMRSSRFVVGDYLKRSVYIITSEKIMGKKKGKVTTILFLKWKEKWFRLLLDDFSKQILRLS